MAVGTAARGGPPGAPGADGNDGADGADGVGFTLSGEATHTTTNNTPYDLVTVLVPENTSITYEAFYNAIDTGSGDAAAYVRVVSFARGTGNARWIASSVIYGGSPEDAALSTATVGVAANSTNAVFSATGVTGRNVKWVCKVYEKNRSTI